MKLSATSEANRTRSSGFTILELLIVVAMAMIIAGIAIPYTLSAYRTYELNSAASQVASILKFTRMEAIRLNKPVPCREQAVANGTQIWSDDNNDNIAQPTEQQILLTSSGDLVALASVPNNAQIAAALGIANLTAPGNSITFDQRGAVVNPAGVYAICLHNTATTAPGYRAVILLPSGAIQLWSADSAGNWNRVD